MHLEHCVRGCFKSLLWVVVPVSLLMFCTVFTIRYGYYWFE